MERLTERYKDGLHKMARIKGTENMCCDEVCNSVDYCADCLVDKAFSRLADIEDILGDDYGLDWLKEVVEADKEYRCEILPFGIGETVYMITKCKYVPKILDGTLYDWDGSPGTATGRYCPYELCKRCPFKTDEGGWTSCEKHREEYAVFEDTVISCTIGDPDSEYYMGLDFNSIGFSEKDVGESVFRDREKAEEALKKMKELE